MSDTLVAAKQEYTTQLCDILSPLLYKGFKSIWKNCKDSGKASLKSFQEKLTSVPIWNQDIIDNEYNRIIKETDCQWLDKLIEAVFLSNVKVLSTVRIGKAKTINITVPETKRFIHQCYVEGARRLWQDPYLIDDRQETLTYAEVKRNEKRMALALADSIEKTISKLIPIQNILESYLNEIDDEVDNEVSESGEIAEPTGYTGLENAGYSSDQEFSPENYSSDKEEEKVIDNASDSDKDPVDDLFTTEPPSPDQNTSSNLENDLEGINLNVTEGNTVEDSTTTQDFDFQNGKNITINSSAAEEESPFFSDSDNE